MYVRFKVMYKNECKVGVAESVNECKVVKSVKGVSEEGVVIKWEWIKV